MKVAIVKRDGERADLSALYRNFEVVKSGYEICIAVGGDGTFLKAAQMTDRPVLLIRDGNERSSAYHSDIGIKDLGKAVRLLKGGKYKVEHLSNRIEITCKGRKYYAVNEARLNFAIREVSFRVFEKVGNRRIRICPFTLSGDGLILTSKMGSTAYNRSAGGPILLEPDMMCITFLNIDGPFCNPIVFSGRKEIEVEIAKYEGTLGYDSDAVAKLKEGDRFTARLSDRQISVVRLDGFKHGIADRLERKIRSKMLR